MRRLSIAGLVALFVACTPAAPVLHLATTTSVENSGLLADLLPAFQVEAGIEVQAIAVGSGRALEILQRGDADAALTHDPDAEARLIGTGGLAAYRKVMYNDFLIAGPAADPAGLRQAADALDAMRRIADSTSPFASRADSSGTHAREVLLWRLVGRAPSGSRLIETGQGQSATLRIASERRAYVLTDRATFGQLAPTLQLEELVSGDPRLINTYSIMYRKGLPDDRLDRARRLFDWLTDGNGRTRIAGYRVSGQQAFFVWPPGQPRDQPGDLPHVG